MPWPRPLTARACSNVIYPTAMHWRTTDMRPKFNAWTNPFSWSASARMPRPCTATSLYAPSDHCMSRPCTARRRRDPRHAPLPGGRAAVAAPQPHDAGMFALARACTIHASRTHHWQREGAREQGETELRGRRDERRRRRRDHLLDGLVWASVGDRLLSEACSTLGAPNVYPRRRFLAIPTSL